MTEQPNRREVELSDGQFMAHGVDEVNAQHLAACLRDGDHAMAAEVISYLPANLQEVTSRIYERCKEVKP